MTSNRTVTVYGAYGHTGRFVVSELRKRGWTPILSGRDADKLPDTLPDTLPDRLNAIGAAHPGLEIRPAMAFYGGLGDLLATAAMGNWPEADEIFIASGLSSWKPTLGTRAAGQVSKQRRNGQRIVFSKGRMEFRTDTAPITEWTFPPPIGT